MLERQPKLRLWVGAQPIAEAAGGRQFGQNIQNAERLLPGRILSIDRVQNRLDLGDGLRITAKVKIGDRAQDRDRRRSAQAALRQRTESHRPQR
ncbi:MAG: hypothetical protein IPN59_13360 [Holophaga sp.]|nr:hypothetical protein [Holophaga sp.]